MTFFDHLGAFIGRLQALPDLLHKDLQELKESLSAQQEGYRHQQQIKPECISKILSLDDESKRDRATRDDRQYGVQNSIRWAAWSAFVAAAFYGAVTAGQWWDLRHNFKLEQRPWISISDQAIVLSPEMMDAEIKFTNTGKTPARNVQKATQIKINPLPLMDGPLDAEVRDLDFRGHSILGPQGTVRVRVGTEAEVGGKAIILKNALKDRFPAIDSGDQILYLFGEIKYEDVSGGQRTTKYCLYAVKLETVWELAECNKFNEMD